MQVSAKGIFAHSPPEARPVRVILMAVSVTLQAVTVTSTSRVLIASHPPLYLNVVVQRIVYVPACVALKVYVLLEFLVNVAYDELLETTDILPS